MRVDSFGRAIPNGLKRASMAEPIWIMGVTEEAQLERQLYRDTVWICTKFTSIRGADVTKRPTISRRPSQPGQSAVRNQQSTKTRRGSGGYILILGWGERQTKIHACMQGHVSGSKHSGNPLLASMSAYDMCGRSYGQKANSPASPGPKSKPQDPTGDPMPP